LGPKTSNVERRTHGVYNSVIFGKMYAPTITAEELKAKRDRGEPVTLVDVREPHEWAISDLAGSVKIPLATLPQRLGELPRDEEIVVYCRTGGRSGNAVQFLRQKGFDKALNLAGGINHWAEVVDPALPRY
jgi:sulfur-carrier protein adenylyltransferase/sulfurtransferase